MVEKDKCKRSRAVITTLLILLPLLIYATHSYSIGFDVKKIRLAIFPFNDLKLKSLNMSIPAVLKAELSNNEFIENVPVEIIRQQIYEIEPAFLWTEKEGSEKEGGILWRIKPKVVEEVQNRVSAEFSIYGDLTRFGNKWRVDAYIRTGGDFKSGKSFTISGLKDEEISEKLTEMAKNIASWLKKENVVNEAEEDIRRYMGGLYTYSAVLEKIKSHVHSFPESIPLHALLLDLYLKDKQKYQNEVMDEGLKIISLYDPSRDEDIRYLLSLSIDPFDVTATVYEKREDWENAVDIRSKALELFPYKANNHKNGLGKDYYFLALTLEKRGQKARAVENYKRAMTYLQPSSEYFKPDLAGLERLNDSSN